MNSFQKFLSKVLPPFLSHGKLFTFGPPWTRFAFTFFTAERLIREGYKANAAVSACATTLQLTFPEPPLITGTKENGRFTPDYSHPMLALLEDPNEDMGQAEFLQYIITYASIGGNAYIWKQRAQNGQILALWPFSDVQIRPIRGIDTDEGFIAYYEYFSGFGVPTAISKDDIIHWKWMIDPQYPWRGIGAIELSAREVDKDSEATAYIYSLLKNNAVPPVVITMEEGD